MLRRIAPPTHGSYSAGDTFETIIKLYGEYQPYETHLGVNYGCDVVHCWFILIAFYNT